MNDKQTITSEDVGTLSTKPEYEFKIGARFQLRTDTEPLDFVEDGFHVGRYVPGLGYWVTDRNMAWVKKNLIDTRKATLVDPGTAPTPIGGIDLSSSEGKVAASVSLGAVPK
jgi:hypothetical protein